MPRYINVEDALQAHPEFLNEQIDDHDKAVYAKGWNACNSAFYGAIKELPIISPDEVRGVGEITGDDACPSCGCWIPTDDAHDAIFKNEVKFCYYCGMRLRMKGADDGTTDNP